MCVRGECTRLQTARAMAPSSNLIATHEIAAQHHARMSTTCAWGARRCKLPRHARQRVAHARVQAEDQRDAQHAGAAWWRTRSSTSNPAYSHVQSSVGPMHAARDMVHGTELA